MLAPAHHEYPASLGRRTGWWRSVALATLAGAGLTAQAATVALPQPPVVQGAGATLNAVLTATNTQPYRLSFGDAGAGAPETLDVDGLYLYRLSPCATCGPASLLPARLAARRGQTVNVSFRNAIGAVPAAESSQANLHMHGALVPVRAPAAACATRGDDVFVASLPNGGADQCAPLPGHAMGADTMQMATGRLRYSYRFSADHPSGLYWYHPHVHGFAESQVSGGMSGLFTVGDFWDAAFIGCAPAGTQAAAEHPHKRCRDSAAVQTERARRAQVSERYLLLKDVQIERQPNGRHARVAPYDKALCGAPQPGNAAPNTQPGYCASADGARRWVFTVNGVAYPSIDVAHNQPQVWRIANAGADVLYRLQLVVTQGNAQVAAGTALPLRVLAQDGATLAQAGAGQMVRTVALMPSARSELLLDPCAMGLGSIASDGRCVIGGGIVAELRTLGADVAASPGGADVWPAMPLAIVRFAPTPTLTQSLDLQTVAPAIPAQASAPAAAPMARMMAAPAMAMQPACTPSVLAPGRVRVIRFKNGTLADGSERFGMRADQSDMLLPASSSAIQLPMLDAAPAPDLAADYSMMGEANSQSRLCIQHGQVERWVLVNDSQECHNFHIHQMRFRVRRIQAGGTPADEQCLGNRAQSIAADAWHDNFPLPPGARVLIDMAFDRPEQIGKFVYHCHILEHEDKGMMAVVEVVR